MKTRLCQESGFSSTQPIVEVFVRISFNSTIIPSTIQYSLLPSLVADAGSGGREARRGASVATATAATVGLSEAHISPLVDAPVSPYAMYREDGSIAVAIAKKASGHFRIYPEGSLLRIKRAPLITVRSGHRQGGGRRSYVSGFSGSSRRRLMQLLGTVKRSCIPTFLTLTYPSTWPEPAICKKHLDTFAKRLKRHSPNVSAIWKLEFQKRGAPHFHLLCWNLDTEPGFRAWLSNAWYEIVGSGDVRHLMAGTRVEYIRSWRGIMSYASKYMGKDVDIDENWGRPGRFWGILGRDKLPWADSLSGDLTYVEANLLMRFACRYMGKAGKRQRKLWGTSLFVENPLRWLDLLDRLPEYART